MIDRLLPGFRGLLRKELMRYLAVPIQTIFGPVLSSALFMMIFTHVFEGRSVGFKEVGYFTFLVPGLAAMTMLQNSFANSSSSLIHSKVTGNIVMLLLAPISPPAFFLAYLIAALSRGAILALMLIAVGAFFETPRIDHPLWALAFLLSGGVATGAMGVIAGIYAERFDQIALIQTAAIMPLTFLSGVFYSIESLPPLWQKLSLVNPFTYFVDGFRYGFIGRSDTDVTVSFLITCITALSLSIIAWLLIRCGWRTRN